MSLFLPLTPELILGLTLISALFAEATYQGERARLVRWITFVGFLTAWIESIVGYLSFGSSILSGTVTFDGVGLGLRSLAIFLGLLTIGFSFIIKRTTSSSLENVASEFCFFTISGSLGLALAAVSSHVLLLFFSLQLFVFSSGFLIGLKSNSLTGTEAALKYFLYQVAASLCLLLGLFFLTYGAPSLFFSDVIAHFQSGVMSLEQQRVSLVFLLMTLTFFNYVVPFHYWVPDVLVGAPLPVAMKLVVGSQIAGLIIAVRFLMGAFSSMGEPWSSLVGLPWEKVLASVASGTVLFGGLLALRQTEVRRLIAYLVISQAGFHLMGVVVMSPAGMGGVFFTLVAECLAIVGLYSTLGLISKQIEGRERFGRGGTNAPVESVLFVLFLSALIGVPPFPESIGRAVIISGLVDRGSYGFAFITIVASVFSWVAAARLAGGVFGGVSRLSDSGVATQSVLDIEDHSKSPTQSRILLVVLLLPLLVMSWFANGILEWAKNSLQF